VTIRITLTAIVPSACAALAATAALAADPEPQYGGELIYAQAGEQFSLFPGRNLDSGAQDVWLYACEGLVELDEEAQIVPWLAKSWSVGDDGKVYTFELEEGVTFHDGTPFNAEAVAFVFNEAVAKEFIYANLLEGLEEVTADGEHTVSFHFAEPFAALLPNLAYKPLCIFSPTAYQEKGEEWMATNIVGTGPFIQDDFVKGEYIRFVKNPNYWQEGKPYLDAVKIINVPDMALRTAMLEKGEIDRTVTLNDFDVPRLEKDENIKIRVVPSTRQYYVVLNHLVHPFGNVNVRKAFNYAMDKVGIVSSVFADQGAVLSKAPTIAEGVYGFADMREPGEETIFPYDPERAKTLLKNAGYEDRDGNGVVEDPKGNELRLGLWTRRGGTKGDYQTAQLIQAFLGEIGVPVEITVMESAAFSSAVKVPPTEAEYDMALLSWGIPTADPDEPMMLFTYTKAWKPFGSNRMFYSSEEIDRLTALAHTETDQEKRKEYVKLWMEELLRDAPVIYLPTLTFNLGERTYLHGGRILGTDNYPARFAWIDQEEMTRQGVTR
jgi:peptide/nickel transport system substrate-binding protein